MPIVLKYRIHVYNIIVYVSARDGHVYGDLVTSIIYDRSRGLTFAVLKITRKR